MMDIRFTKETRMLNYRSDSIKKLIKSRKWRNLNEYEKIKAVYSFVQNEIPFAYNQTDNLRAEQVLADGYGQCNTKATLLMALLRGLDIPCRIHGFEVSKSFQRGIGVTSALISALAPNLIVHTWAEVYYQGQWLALEGVITDKKYLQAVKAIFPNVKKSFSACAIATDDFENLSIDWKGKNTYVQSSAIVTDLGTFSSPDEFFKKHSQHWSKTKNFFYVHIARKMMNRSVEKIRKTVD